MAEKERFSITRIRQVIGALNGDDYYQILHNERSEIGALARELSGMIHQITFSDEQKELKGGIRNVVQRLTEWGRHDHPQFLSQFSKELSGKISTRNQVLDALNQG